jgi:hypothetical protein
MQDRIELISVPGIFLYKNYLPTKRYMPKQMKNYIIIYPIIFTLIGLFLILVNQSVLAYSNYISERTLSPISVISTRIKEIPFNTTQLVNFTLSKFGSGCPPEIAIYIHGYNRDDTEAKEEFNRIQTSLNHSNYRIPLIGFSWDSKTLWEIAKSNAKYNGPKLAQFIVDFKNKCPNTDNIRLIAHSLGAEVVDSTLVSLDNNTNWKSKIASVHLLAAAINNQLIAKNTAFGNATEHVVDKFYNFYNPEDDGLEVNQLIENHNPLGLVGAPNGTALPLNYNDTNVAYEIPPISDADGDGNVEECFEDIKPVRLWGDNHCGYIGFRQPFEDSLIDDGAMNIVVRDWIKS